MARANAVTRLSIPLFALALAAALPSAGAGAGEVLQGPISAHVLEVIDGDTIAVRARVWLGHDVEIRVRLSGIDAPELRARCAGERRLAVKARDLVAARTSGGAVTLTDIRYGKFAGRVVARVATSAGEDLGAALMQAGLARSYSGGGRISWCAGEGRG